MEPLKNIYNRQFFETFTRILKSIFPSFQDKNFLAAIHTTGWQQMELKQRIRHISMTLGKFLPGTYKNQLKIIAGIVTQLQKGEEHPNSFAWICLPDFIEIHGLAEVELSLDAMEKLTAFISCEFAVRPFLLADPETVMKRMLIWSKHPNENVRRFASEGCRPRLPWGKAIPAFKLNPAPILPVLENLKDDPSEFVRKSVANNINDIAKDHPGIVLDLIKKWKGRSKNTDWILKHGSRTLLRKADPAIYKQFGLSAAHSCELSAFKLGKKEIKIGDTISVAFVLTNKSVTRQLVRLELAVHYMKSSGTTTRKLFKLSEKMFSPGLQNHFTRNINFKDLTTRTHYVGRHAIGVVVNGREMATKHFNVTNKAALV